MVGGREERGGGRGEKKRKKERKKKEKKKRKKGPARGGPNGHRKWPPDPGTVPCLPSEMQRHWIVGKLSTSNPVEKIRKKDKQKKEERRQKGERGGEKSSGGNIWYTYEDAYDDINRNNHAMISHAISSMIATEDIRKREREERRSYGENIW